MADEDPTLEQELETDTDLDTGSDQELDTHSGPSLRDAFVARGFQLPDEVDDDTLVNHITGGADAKTFQPMNVNFGLYPPLDEMRGGRKGRKDRYPAYTDRAKADFNQWLAGQS